jgi:hypothetical protein
MKREIAKSAKSERPATVPRHEYDELQKENTRLKEALAKINILNADKDADIKWLIEQALSQVQWLIEQALSQVQEADQ